MAWSIFRQVKEALDAEDIEGLLALECPADEYDGEASTIESAVATKTQFGKTKVSAEELEAIIRSVWNRSFGPFHDDELNQRQEAFRKVAQQISDIIKD